MLRPPSRHEFFIQTSRFYQETTEYEPKRDVQP